MRLHDGAAAAVLALAFAACGPERTDAPSTASGSSDAGTSSGGDGLPATCTASTSPFLAGECLGDLRASCNALATASACEAASDFVFDGYTVRCTWTEVARVADPASCAIAEVTARCEAAMPTECGNSCDGDALVGDVTAITSSAEILRVCGGPLGPWSAVGAQQDDVVGCAADTPGLCACLDEACAAY